MERARSAPRRRSCTGPEQKEWRKQQERRSWQTTQPEVLHFQRPSHLAKSKQSGWCGQCLCTPLLGHRGTQTKDGGEMPQAGQRHNSTVNIRLYGTLVHFVAHLVFQEIYSLTTATSCRLLDRANEMRSFRTIVRCCSLVRPQRSRSSQLYGRVPYNWSAYNRILTVESVGNSRCGSNMAIFSIGAAPTAWVEPFRTHICTHAGLPTLSSVEEAATLLNADRMIDIRSYICSGAAGCSISSPLQRAAARRRQSDHLPPARRGVKGHRRSPLLLHLTFAATPTGIHFFTQARSSACRQLTVGAPPATHRRDS